MTTRTPLTIPPSARLRFRLMDAGDADLLFDLDQDPEVMRFLNEGKPTPRNEIEYYFIPRMLAFTNAATGCGMWAVEDQASSDYLGWILVREYGFSTHYHDPQIIELGWRIYRQWWGRGIATEAARAIMLAVVRQSGITRICALADPDNGGSIGVMKKLGMQYVDDRVHQTPKGDFPVAYYEMTVSTC
jgi:RimJ/RimL family protein N-acetyltransferase